MSRDDARLIAQIVDGLTPDASWSAWTQASHVLTRLDEDIELTTFERALDRDLASLVAVCRAPRLLLRHEEERSPVSRVRRVAARTVSDLLSRPADWERRTLQGIQPARVLSVVIQDDWDLYENRVAARLIDKVLKILGGRIERVEKIAKMLRDGENFSDTLKHSHWRTARLVTTWLRVAHDDRVRERVDATLSALRRMNGVVGALAATALYQSIARNAHVPDALRATNILSNDPHYRKIAALWRMAAPLCAGMGSSAESLSRDRSNDLQNLDVYARLLTIQALAARGYTPAEGEMTTDASLQLTGPRGALTLSRGAHGVTTLTIEGETLSVVALPVRLEHEDAASFAHALKSAHAGSPRGQTIYLAHGALERLVPASLDSETRRILSGWSKPRVLFVSPTSLDAVERLGGVLERWEVAERLRRYPPRQAWRGPPPKSLPSQVIHANGQLVVRSPLSDEGLTRLDTEIASMRAGDSAAAGALRKASGDPNQTPLVEALVALKREAKAFAWAASCPLCPERRVRFESRADPRLLAEDQTFFARCDGCSATWELRRCGRCRARFPSLDTGLTLSCPDEVCELDAVYGRDLWSELRPASPRPTPRCPECGE